METVKWLFYIVAAVVVTHVVFQVLTGQSLW